MSEIKLNDWKVIIKVIIGIASAILGAIGANGGDGDNEE